MDEEFTKINIMQVDNLIDFSKLTNGKLIFDYDLKNNNWFNIGGKTKAFFKPNNLEDLIKYLYSEKQLFLMTMHITLQR